MITSSLVTLASLAPQNQFLCKLGALKAIEGIWREGDEVSIERIETASLSSKLISVLLTPSETSHCEEGSTSESGSNGDGQVYQTAEEAVTTSSSECLLSGSPDSSEATGSLASIEEEDLNDLELSIRQMVTTFLQKLFDVDEPFDLLDYMEKAQM